MKGVAKFMPVAQTTIKEYLQHFIDNLVIDNTDFFQLSFDNFKFLEQRLPEGLREQTFFEYTLMLYNVPFNSLEEFYEESELYGGDVQNLEGKVIININKEELLHSINPNIRNAFLFSHIDNIYKSVLGYENIDTEYKVDIFLINGIESISNEFVNIHDFNPDLLTTYENTFILNSSKEQFRATKEAFENKEINYYHQIPHFWNFKSSHSDLLGCKKQCVIRFFNIISNKIKVANSEYVIKGHHNLTFKLGELNSDIETQNFIDLLNFTLDDVDRHLDKLLIIRNVLTTYLNNLSTIEQLNLQAREILSTTNHHFELYIENEVKIFIEQKNQLLNETLSIAKLVSEQTVETSKHLRTLLITLFAAIIAYFIPSVQESINGRGIATAASILYIVYLLFNYYIAIKMENQHQNNLSSLENYINYMSSQSLSRLNYSTLKEQFIQKEEENLISILKVYKNTIKTLVFCSLFALLVIYFDFLSQNIN